MAAAAVLASTEPGRTTRRSAGESAFSAYDPVKLTPATRSPTSTAVTPEPTATTLPAASVPGTHGRAPGYWPVRWYTSTKFTPTASSLTSASPGPGFGSG